jgi:hypothetical protein
MHLLPYILVGMVWTTALSLVIGDDFARIWINAADEMKKGGLPLGFTLRLLAGIAACVFALAVWTWPASLIGIGLRGVCYGISRAIGALATARGEA